MASSDCCAWIPTVARAISKVTKKNLFRILCVPAKDQMNARAKSGGKPTFLTMSRFE